MAISFPASLSEFFNKLPVKAATPYLRENMSINFNGHGEILTSDMGERLWQMELALIDDRYDALEKVRGLLNMMRQPGRTFFAHALPLAYPQADPDGELLVGFTPTLRSVAANRRELTLGGLPTAYVLTEGDYLSFSYGSSPTRYAFHQVVVGSEANGSGNTGQIEVTPEIRSGYTLNVNVRLIRPFFKAILVPNTASLGTSSGMFTRGITLSAVQTLGR